MLVLFSLSFGLIYSLRFSVSGPLTYASSYISSSLMLYYSCQQINVFTSLP